MDVQTLRPQWAGNVVRRNALRRGLVVVPLEECVFEMAAECGRSSRSSCSFRAECTLRCRFVRCLLLRRIIARCGGLKVGSLECVCLSLLAATPILLVSLEMVRLVGGWDARWLDQTNASPSNPHRRRDPRHRPSLPITPSDPCSEDILLESRARTCVSCGLI
jgi:hypothetical protein